MILIFDNDFLDKLQSLYIFTLKILLYDFPGTLDYEL